MSRWIECCTWSIISNSDPFHLMENWTTINWILIVWIALCIREILTLRTTIKQRLLVKALHPHVHLFRSYTQSELASFTEDLLLVSIRGKVYDVSVSRNFYGKEGPYHAFAGREVAGMLARNDLSGLGDFDPLTASQDELEVLRSWEERFQSKYIQVGTLVTTP